MTHRRETQGWCIAALLVALLFQLAAIALPQRVEAAGTTYYVSKNGNNQDGESWATAWDELNQINWNAVQPGDTIYVGAGTYVSTLTVGKAGTSAEPITIRAEGQVIVDGQGSRRVGIAVNRSYIVIDGVARYGFEVTGHTWAGIEVNSSGDHVTLQYLYIHHNPPNPSGGDVFGIRSSDADNFTVRNCEISNNGQDAIQSILGGDDVVLEGSYLHSHFHNHPDGLQQQGGDGLIIRNNVLTDGFMQGIFLGENNGRDAWNTDVRIYDNLIYNHDYGIKSKNTNTRDWEVHHNTFAYLGIHAIQWCCADPGARAPMSVHDNIFYQTGGFYLNTDSGGTDFTDNCLHDAGYVGGNVNVSGTINADPQFVDPTNGDFALQPGSPCTGKGSAITSLDALYALDGTVPTATPSPTSTLVPSPTPTVTASPTSPLGPTPTPTVTASPTSPLGPTPTPTVTASPTSPPGPTSTPTVTASPTSTPGPSPTPPIMPGLAWEAEDGAIAVPFIVGTEGGRQYVYQAAETSDPAQGGRAMYSFNIPSTGKYVVKMVADAPSDGSNSLFVNIDGEPVNPDMIWDIPSGQGFQESTVSWRGNGTYDSPEFAPKVFTLFAGQHELIIRGREQQTFVDSVKLEYVEELPPGELYEVFVPHVSR